MYEEGKVVYAEAFAEANLTTTRSAGWRLEGLTLKWGGQQWELDEGLQVLVEASHAPLQTNGGRSLLAGKKKKTKCSFPELLVSTNNSFLIALCRLLYLI